ncbi:MAG: M42 family metallopeptidase [Firmicutes bacterium]|nr:M42 family metallopeptidase [Bacillota bacterium]
MKDLVKRLTSISSPSGFEDEIREAIKSEVKDYCDEIRVDALGNLIAVRRGTGPKIQFAAHMDEIGMIATDIDEKGFVRFSNVGGVSPHRLFGQRVRFTNGVVGTIGMEKLDDIKELNLDKLFIDIGATSRESAQELISIGDCATYLHGFDDLGQRIVAKAMDDRIGCAVLIEAMRRTEQCQSEVYCTFTVQEEVGLRGAATSAFGIDPDLGIAIDVTGTGDTPESRRMAVSLGKGTAIKVKDQSVIAHPKVKQLLVDLAERNGVPYQLEVLTAGGTDSGAIHLTRDGVRSGVISIPSRYIHCPSEMVDMIDVEASVKLVSLVMSADISEALQ